MTHTPVQVCVRRDCRNFQLRNSLYAMGLHAGVRKRFRARVDSLRPQWPPVVVTYTASEDGAGTSALELPEMRTAYVTAADVAMRDWV